MAHGGYGRRDVAPYSDVDLMILHSGSDSQAVFPVASRLLRDLFDAGLDLGQSVRTTAEACKLAIEDAKVATTLMESRLLAGSEKLFRTFQERFSRRVNARGRQLFRAIEGARRSERKQYGETVYLLEPNVKRTRGGLRELQLLRWLGFLQLGNTDLDALQLSGAISPDDLQKFARRHRIPPPLAQ